MTFPRCTARVVARYRPNYFREAPNNFESVIPAQAGIQLLLCIIWIPASAGMTNDELIRPSLARQRRLGLLGQRGKGLLVTDGDVGKHFAVDLDRGLPQSVHKSAVGQSALARARIDAHDPKRAKIALAHAPVAVRVLAGLHHRLVRGLDVFAAGVVITLGATQNFLVSRAGGNSTFDSRHRSPHAYGSILRTSALSEPCTMVVPRKPRLRLELFFVRI